jgi:AraC family transcriptional regulator
VSYLGGPRQHLLYCFLKPLESEIIFEGERHKMKYRAGEARLTPAGHSVSFRWKGAVQVLILGLEPWFLEGVAAELGAAIAFDRALSMKTLPASHPAAVLIRQLEGELSAPVGASSVAESLARGIAVFLLREFAHLPPAKPTEAAPPVAVLKIVELMRARLAEPLSLEEMARAAGVSPFHFARQFKTATGHPPHEYLVRLRVDHAQELMTTHGRNWTMAAIARECGFADQSHMTRHFRRVLGITPGELAEATRKRGESQPALVKTNHFR